MRLTTRLTLLISAFALFLLVITAFVYQQSYNALKDRIIFDSNLVGDKITDRLHHNFIFTEEYIKFFAITKGADMLSSAKHIGYDELSDQLRQYFINFFETEFGYRLFRDIQLTDYEGNVVASTAPVNENIAHQDWWKEVKEKGTAFSFTKQRSGAKLLTFAVSIVDNKKVTQGVVRANCTMTALVRGGGMEKVEMATRRIDLLTPQGEFLYSTALHRTFAHYADTALFNKIKNGQNSFVHRTKSGLKELIIAKPHLHHHSRDFPWILVLHLDYHKLFEPVLNLRWWIAAGMSALVLTAVIFFIMVKDITSRKEYEQALLKNQQLLQAILEGIEAAVLFIDKETLTITWANTVTEQIFGVPLKIIIGDSCYKYLCPHTEGTKEHQCSALETNNLHAEFKLHRQDNRIIPVIKTVLELEIHDRPHYVVTMFDITARKAIERQLAHAQKLESIGSLAAGIAHEINTPSQFIADNLRFISSSYESLSKLLTLSTAICESEANGHDIEGIAHRMNMLQETIDIKFLLEETPLAIAQSRAGIERITTIVQAMKRFSHPGSDSLRLADINEALKNTSEVCRNEWKYHSEIFFDLQPNLPLVPCLINDINQVFLNLIINAAHAVKKKYEEIQGKGKITIHTEVKGDHIIIQISDNGIGIPKALLERVFDPFFTTKDVGVGTGQGLALSYGIVTDRHKGTIEIQSREGIGTDCTISLPLGKSGEA
ncbi:sensor histidine kinase [Pseudodesulfovibrio piezophilus]|uniref:histidine kinase n=1 Tax=Pseudodesulfovibrio piezophilus (strain DSM 21447 / JCM 15486 / C1TLV30) TaxID=1322246 RepID=M1WJH4_PSEP2|nr:ATP-binding protein [Pseudodesulfovibrio piezophilus]CCH47901.1 putative Histidine kinase [Pseudodesulfovibrio piezophilus C1TLV30]